MSELPVRGERGYFDKLVEWLLTSHNADGTIKTSVLDEIAPTVATQTDLSEGLETKADITTVSELSSDFTDHVADAENPHNVSATQLIVDNADITASRPDATAVDIGTPFYDTTLSLPIWSDGSVWKDAAGNTV